VAVITGLTRKDVRRVAGLNRSEERETAERYNRAARVVAGWRRDANFLDQKGKPMLLSVSGNSNSFQELVRRYSGDVPYRAVLDELEGDGSVERLDENRVKLTQRAYLPKADESMKLHILGVDTSLLIDTIDHNLKADHPFTRFQRKVLYDNLPDEALPEFRRLSAKASQKLLEKFDTWLSQHDRDTRPGTQGSGQNMSGIGIYYFEKPLSDREED
jgi:hypothetical protein